jgi:predicted amidophosphoribosyltransferase
VFCPSCKDEFRPGFTRCENCDVDLVEDLSAAGHSARDAGRASAVAAQMVEYCGFLELDEARRARAQLKTGEILSDIVIRENPEALAENALGEEYWLRVEASKFRQVGPILGYHMADSENAEKTLACGQCGARVDAEATFCAKCRARFEEP